MTWDDITANTAAWNTLVWFATLVALADGLTRVGFVNWFAQTVASKLNGVSPQVAVAMLLLINFFGHYLFASVTAHVTAMIPVLLAVASTIPGVNMHTLALGLCLQLGIMGILTPYATGPSPVYYGSGYLPAADYWRLGAIFGVIFFVAFLVIGVPLDAVHTVNGAPHRGLARQRQGRSMPGESQRRTTRVKKVNCVALLAHLSQSRLTEQRT